MKGFVCEVCGFISINGSAPENCPVCGAPKTSFKEKEDAINTAKDINNPSELKEKHIPVIVGVKKDDSKPEGTLNVDVKIGEIPHPMQAKHYIMYIDSYMDNEFVSRATLSPDKSEPEAVFHLKSKIGKFQAIAHCNLHGAWLGTKNL